MHTFEQCHTRNDTGAETEPTVHDPVLEVALGRITRIIICVNSDDLPLDDEVRQTLVVLWTRTNG